MSKLIVGFSYAPGKVFSKLIRWVTRSQVSHTFTMVVDGADALVYQASGLRVNYEAYKLFLAEEKVVEAYTFDLTLAESILNEHFRKEHVGDHYSWQEIVGFGWVLLMRKFGRVVKNPFSGGDHAFVCVDIAAAQIPYNRTISSELVQRVLGVEAAGEGTMTPEDLRRYCQKNGTQLKL